MTAVLLVASVETSHAAPVRAENGLRCTKVGTSGDDVIKGTPGRDVICGRGGDDRIDSGRGNDVVDGGTGSDVLTGGSGDDTLLGGTGSDSLVAGSGADALSGGSGDDRLAGQDGSDLLRGGDGVDRLEGSTGDDRLEAGAGADVAAGGSGDDRVLGGDGDDDLRGDTGVDKVDGGAGVNVCDDPVARGDTQVRCAVDAAAPAVVDVSVVQQTVDVTSADQWVDVRVRVTDDTGAKRVQIGPNISSLVSGSSRDGTWATRLRVPRYAPAGPRDVDVHVDDRVGRTASRSKFGAYTVTSSAVDVEAPTVQRLTLSTSSVDVRNGPVRFVATARVTDDLSGAADVMVCPAREFGSGTPRFRHALGCSVLNERKGSARDSMFSGVVEMPQGATSGTWNLMLWVTDASDPVRVEYWMGPDQWAAQGSNPGLRDRMIPGGGGVLQVLGSPRDVGPPRLTSLVLPSSVDTSAGAVEVTAEVAAVDTEGLSKVGLFIGSGSEVRIVTTESLQLVRGTRQDGVWRIRFVVPGGTPDGEYTIQVVLQDAEHHASWISPGPDGSGSGSAVLTGDLAPNGTRFVVRNS